MIRKVFKTGHSYAITLSKKVMDKLGLKVGDDVSVEVEEALNHIVIRKEKHRDQLELGLNVRPKLGSKMTEKI